MSKRKSAKAGAVALSGDVGKVLIRRGDGVEVAVYGNDRAPDERAQHGGVDVVDTYVEGRRARASRSIDMLATMQRNGSISAAMAWAGRRFASTFRAAQLDPLRAADVGRVPGSGCGEIDQAAVEARKKVQAIITTLGGHGSPAAQAVWFVLGCGHSIEEWARRESFGRGRSLNRKVASGIVVGALAAIAGYYTGERRSAGARKRA